MLPTSEPRGQLSGVFWLGGVGGGGGEAEADGADENNSRGEGSDPSRIEHSRPVPGDQASVPSIHSPS